ncbi:MAG: hypothetical protein LBI92_04250 [Azoarcus sp.]|nr:hypothetical protein [Azoarcus sp.]
MHFPWKVTKLLLKTIALLALLIMVNFLSFVSISTKKTLLEALGFTVILFEMYFITIGMPCFLYQLLIKRRTLKDSWKITIQALIDCPPLF